MKLQISNIGTYYLHRYPNNVIPITNVYKKITKKKGNIKTNNYY